MSPDTAFDDERFRSEYTAAVLPRVEAAMKTNRRGALQSAMTGLLALLAAPLGSFCGRVGKREREPWIAGVLPGNGHGLVYTASGEVVILHNPYAGEDQPPLTYELQCFLDGKLCPCAYANEAAGVVLVYSDPKTAQEPLLVRTGRVELRHTWAEAPR